MSKTDKFSEGAWVYIARIGTTLCPVLNCEKNLKSVKIHDESE